MHGTLTSAPEITHISKNGIWILLGNEELLLAFDHFPWFEKATIAQIQDVNWPTIDHLYWPQLDIDISVQSIRNPDQFPLVADHYSSNHKS